MTTSAGTGDAMWEAVLGRQAPAEAGWVYAVRSTGIYCLFTCPSRRPGREQVSFFGSCDAAEAAGFRGCLRCKPRAADGHSEIAARVCGFIDHHVDEPLRLADLSRHVEVSSGHLQRVFKCVVGVSPREYAAARRMERLKGELKSGHEVGEAIVEAGYGSSSRVYEQSPDQMGMNPSQYRRGGRNLRIGYSTAPTPLGQILIAATERGVCAVTLGDSDVALLENLRHEYFNATIVRDDERLQPWIHAILRHIEGLLPNLSLPLDVRATAFQRRVWQALQEIPCGETRSYTEIATAIGQPTAARAVARACASNEVAVVIPCHRVVRRTGDLSGYRWGAERKAEILRREKQKGNR